MAVETLPNSASARDKRVQLHPYANARAVEEHGALVITRGDGLYVYDENDTPYLEAMAGLWSASLGFGGEERIVEAATEAMRKLPFYHQFGPKAHSYGVDLSERLLEVAPVPMSKTFFCCSGSEANDTAVKFVWYYNNALGRPKKKKIISRMRGYHGVTVAAASMTGLPWNHANFDLPIDNILHTHCPHYYRGAEDGESEAEFMTRITDDLEAMIIEEGPDTVAAFIAEPVMGAGGVVVPPEGYFKRVQEILKKYDILFIADEVITGFGRTGNYWGCQTFDLQPDILTCAKMLTASYMPLSAVMIRDELFQAIADASNTLGTFGHGYTYGGHPVSCAVGLEVLSIYEERDIQGHAKRLSPYFQKKMRGLGDHPLVGEVRGVGMVAALELVEDKAMKKAFDKARGVGTYFVARAQDHGMISRNIVDAIAVSPPLVIDEAHIDMIAERLEKSLDDTLAMVQAS